MPRRSPGEGSTTLRRDDRWQAALQIGSRRIVIYARSRQEARAKLDALRQQYRTAAERHTLGELLALWLDTGATRWKPRTLANYREDAVCISIGDRTRTPSRRTLTRSGVGC